MTDNCSVAFDFDGTIMPSNLGFEFNKWLIQQSLIRSVLAILFFPLISLLVMNPATIRWGLNLGCYIATAFDTRSPFLLRKTFIEYYFSNPKHIYPQAIERIKAHQAAGEKIVIVSGSQKWLIWGVLKYLGLKDIELVASRQVRWGYGAILSQHCYAQNKVRMALQNGHHPEDWVFGYTDSPDDAAMLRYCKRVYVINPKPWTIPRLRYRIYSYIVKERW